MKNQTAFHTLRHTILQLAQRRFTAKQQVHQPKISHTAL